MGIIESLQNSVNSLQTDRDYLLATVEGLRARLDVLVLPGDSFRKGYLDQIEKELS